MEPHKEWIEEIDGKPYHCTMYLIEIDGKVAQGVNKRPVVSEEQARRNNEKLCQILINTLGRKQKG